MSISLLVSIGVFCVYLLALYAAQGDRLARVCSDTEGARAGGLKRGLSQQNLAFHHRAVGVQKRKIP